MLIDDPGVQRLAGDLFTHLFIEFVASNSNTTRNHLDTLAANAIVVPIIVAVKYLLLVFTILKVLEGRVHGGNER
jgi:hypothetical protein